MKSQEVIEIIKTCRVDSENLVVFLPEIQLDRKTYLAVANHLEALGGKWNKKSKGFVFAKLPDELLPEKMPEHPTSIKKTFQFFPTPRKIADDLIDYAMMWKVGNSNHPKVLEPSAGHGALIESLRESYPNLPFLSVHYCELMKENIEVLAEKKLGHLVGDDFLNYSTENKYDIVIANPPPPEKPRVAVATLITSQTSTRINQLTTQIHIIKSNTRCKTSNLQPPKLTKSNCKNSSNQYGN